MCCNLFFLDFVLIYTPFQGGKFAWFLGPQSSCFVASGPIWALRLQMLVFVLAAVPWLHGARPQPNPINSFCMLVATNCYIRVVALVAQESVTFHAVLLARPPNRRARLKTGPLVSAWLRMMMFLIR